MVKEFLGETKAANHKELAQVMLTSFQALGARMSMKTHYLFSYLDKFPENIGDVSEKQSKQFHQDIKLIEERYQR